MDQFIEQVSEVKLAEPEELEIVLPSSKFGEGTDAQDAPDRELEGQCDPDNFSSGSSGDDSPVMGGYPAAQESSNSLFDMEAGNFDDYNIQHE